MLHYVSVCVKLFICTNKSFFSFPIDRKMADENSNSNPVSSLLGYKSLSESANLNNHTREQHINEGFDDNELNYNPPFNGYALANIEVANSRYFQFLF